MRKPPRNPAEGVWVARDAVQDFLQFCRDNGHATREHPDPFRDAHQIRHKNHWMSIIWNKFTERYTADRRLSLIVQSFAGEQSESTR